MWTSTAASGFGDRMIMLAGLALLGGMVAGVDATATQASTQFWFFLPYLVFSVVGGWLADVMPRKWLLLLCDEFRGVILLLAAWQTAQMAGSAQIAPDAVWFNLAGIDFMQTWRVCGILFLIGIFAATFNPTRNAIIPQIIPTPQLTAGNAIILVINIVASQVGLLAGQKIISQTDAASVKRGLLIGAAFYIVSGTFFAFLKPVESAAREARGTGPRSLFMSSDYVRRHRRVAILIVLNLLIWPAAAVVTSALFGLGKMHYNLAGDALLRHFAFLSVALGVGMLVGAAIVSAISVRRESPIVYMTAIAGAGLAIVLLAAVPWLPIAYLACLLIGICGNIAIVAILTLIQSMTPNYVRGRIMGLNALLSTALSVVTYLSIWRLPDADRNIVPVMFVLGPGLVIVGAWGLLAHLRSGPTGQANTNVLWHLNRLFVLVWHRLRWTGRENIPSGGSGDSGDSGGVIFASNHTTGLDPLLIQAACPRRVRWLMIDKYQLRALNFVWRAVKPISFTLGDKATAQVRAVVEALDAGEVVGIFPEGGLQRDVRELQPFGAGVVMIAQRSGAPVVPVWIAGTPRKKSLLAHLLWPSRSRVRFGEPYIIDANADRDAALEELKQRMLALTENR